MIVGHWTWNKVLTPELEAFHADFSKLAELTLKEAKILPSPLVGGLGPSLRHQVLTRDPRVRYSWLFLGLHSSGLRSQMFLESIGSPLPVQGALIRPIAFTSHIICLLLQLSFLICCHLGLLHTPLLHARPCLGHVGVLSRIVDLSLC